MSDTPRSKALSAALVRALVRQSAPPGPEIDILDEADAIYQWMLSTVWMALA